MPSSAALVAKTDSVVGVATTLEALLTEPGGFGLTTASPLQRAIMRAADGLPVNDAALLKRHFGVSRETTPVRPKLVEIIAGVRGGKTLLAGVAAVFCALHADLTKLRRNEMARVPIVAPTVDNANATFRLMLAGIQESDQLRPMLVGDPTGNRLVLRRRDGRKVEIMVVAAHRGAVTLRSRWLAGFVFDEVAQFGQGSLGYEVNAEELLKGAEPRLVPGGQGWLISSPWGSQGLLYDLWKTHYGRPGRVLVVHAPTEALNPDFGVDPVVVAAMRAADPDTAAREFDAAWTDPEQALIPASHVDAATVAEEARRDRYRYSAAMDPGTRSNAWALAIGCRRVAGPGLVDAVVRVREWRGSTAEPLSPDKVAAEIAAELEAYGIKDIVTDQYAADALRDIFRRHGIHVWDKTITSTVKTELFENLRTGLADQRVQIVANAQLRTDLLLLKKRIGLHGISIELPRTPDGRHCDYAMAVALLLGSGLRDPEAIETAIKWGTPEWYRQAEREQFERDVAASEAAGRDAWEGVH